MALNCFSLAETSSTGFRGMLKTGSELAAGFVSAGARATVFAPGDAEGVAPGTPDVAGEAGMAVADGAAALGGGPGG